MRSLALLAMGCVALGTVVLYGDEPSTMPTQPAEPKNMVKNGSFVEVDKDGKPLSWKLNAAGQEVSVDKQERPKGAAQSLKVAVKKEKSGQGSVYQKITDLPKNAKLVLKVQVKGSSTRLGYVQIKLKREGKELRRLSSGWNTLDWEEHKAEFSTEDADELNVECRFSQSDKAVDQTVWFANVTLVKAE